MELIAAGRDCDVFDLGDGTVLRRHRAGGSIEHEAVVMAHVAAHGFPCPRVHRAAGPDLVLDLVDGPTLADQLLADPSVERAAAAGAALADLHERLHRIPPLGDGPSILHLDLHPFNVIAADAGPVLIDWSNAREGDGALDVAMSWVILVPYLDLAGDAVPALIDAILAGTDRGAAEAQLAGAAELRLRDPNLTDDEREAIVALLRTR